MEKSRFKITISKTDGKSAQENALQKDDQPQEQSSVARRTLGAMNTRVYHEKNKSTIRIPGFKYDDFDRAGNLDIVKCCRLTHASMMHAFPWLLELSDAKRGDLALFVVANHYVVSRHLYDRAAVDYPMLLSWWPTGVGRSSVDIATSLREESTGRPLVSNRLRLVLTDSTTQKSVPLPDELRRQVKADCSDGVCQFPAFRLDQSAFPTCRTFPVDVRVPYVDNDQLDHVTQAGYTVFVRECAAQATVAGFYGRVTGDFVL